ncbi:TPA: WGR domain-containing protein [Burkholderia vietnamiensis]|nr:WGR domain-containing protein [Burkholderia vietnamiensis]
MSRVLKECWACWKREDGRRYAATVQRDLFGGWSIIAMWGSEDNWHIGGQAVHPLNSPEDARVFMSALHRVRKAHGYQLIAQA